MGPLGPIEGWHVLVPAGDLADHGRGLRRPSARELDTIRARCVAACEAEYESEPALAADCRAGAYSAGLTGTVGYSFCREDGGSCPFYLGSLEARTVSAVTPSMTCADGTRAQVRVENLVVMLSQPAFGIARSAPSVEKGFPKGGLILESALDVGATHVSRRRPTTDDVVVRAQRASFDAQELRVELSVPCNTSEASLTVSLRLRGRGQGHALGRPPVVKNTTAHGGACGEPRLLTASVSDPDDDAGPVRFRVDGVLLAPGTSRMIVSGPHTLDAIVRDARGATTTARR